MHVYIRPDSSSRFLRKLDEVVSTYPGITSRDEAILRAIADEWPLTIRVPDAAHAAFHADWTIVEELGKRLSRGFTLDCSQSEAECLVLAAAECVGREVGFI